jgi:hypothetical protein
MMLRQAQTSEPRAFPRFAPVRPRTASRANPPFVRQLPPHARANARFAYENRRQYGRTASSGSVVHNNPVNAIDPSGQEGVLIRLNTRTMTYSIHRWDDAITNITTLYLEVDGRRVALEPGGTRIRGVGVSDAKIIERLNSVAKSLGYDERFGSPNRSQRSSAFVPVPKPRLDKPYTEPEARTRAHQFGWVEVSIKSPEARSKFYRDKKGYLWTRDVDIHHGGAWKKYSRDGRTRLGTYDANLNRIGKLNYISIDLANLLLKIQQSYVNQYQEYSTRIST